MVTAPYFEVGVDLIHHLTLLTNCHQWGSHQINPEILTRHEDDHIHGKSV